MFFGVTNNLQNALLFFFLTFFFSVYLTAATTPHLSLLFWLLLFVLFSPLFFLSPRIGNKNNRSNNRNTTHAYSALSRKRTDLSVSTNVDPDLFVVNALKQ
ncbi:hypothetical protein BDB00DRAFT_799851 [Zychaea mexicana]|uniref:uncharacterized protein n=1 Tax=Zychaea mexicana TaxID=64656 RepID=UPI0022FEA775|nr:uncharacterized protein BDB00DRAFT_799851 [Zychaea mexicana]KAI9498327.1 hypothetical protein BDB00DRAFT_799851 [Zychaea mexicana]